MRADVRSFLAEEPNTPPDAEDDDGREEDLDKDDDVEVESGWECCAPLSSPTWLSCEKKNKKILKLHCSIIDWDLLFIDARLRFQNCFFLMEKLRSRPNPTLWPHPEKNTVNQSELPPDEVLNDSTITRFILKQLDQLL